MPHIHNNPGDHDFTTSSYILRKDVDGKIKIWLHKHKKLNRILPTGGHIELNETPWQGALHEIKEETGYDVTELKIYQPKLRIKSMYDVKLHPLPFSFQTHAIADDHHHSDVSYAFWADDYPAGVISEGESSDVMWCSRQEIANFTDDQMFNNARQASLFILDELINDWELVPATDFEA